ncbi:unnamed protein product [Closterium sp. NIES-53]
MEGQDDNYATRSDIASLRTDMEQTQATLRRLEAFLTSQPGFATAAAATTATAAPTTPAAVATPTFHGPMASLSPNLEAARTRLPEAFDPSAKGSDITRDRARRTIFLTHSHMVQQVLQRFDFQFSSPQPTPLSTGHSLSAPPSDESVELSGPYPELVGCLIYLMTCTRPDLAYPLSLLARYMAPGRHRKVHWEVAKRVLRYFYEVEIYAGAMAAQELCWLTYLLTDLGERPRSPPDLYVDDTAMIALCQDQRLEHKTMNIALRYFLTRELQQRGQLHLAYVATQASTADVFTKALGSSDHQRFCSALGLVPTLPHLLVS